MGRITELLDTAHSRSRAHSWSFAGAMLPHEAHELRQLAPGARLIDVRSRVELELSGVIPDALQATDPESLLIFICRNGARSHGAAAACTEAGRGNCYNVLEGFEGDLNKATGHRNEINGWKYHGLPWTQS